MAFSATKRGDDSLAGTWVAQQWDLDFDSVTTGTFDTGLNYIFHVSVNNYTTEGDGLAVENSDDGTADSAKGQLYFSGFTSDDKATCVVFGY